jgi:outer membrane lipoprotein carrier protein
MSQPRLIISLILAVALPALGFSQSGNKSVEQIVERSEKIYSEAGHFTAKFTQTLSAGEFFEDETTSGKMIIGYPDKFRIESPDQTLVSDGDSLWSYSVENKQVTIEDMSTLNDIVTPADYLFRFKEHYQIASDTIMALNGNEAYHLHLVAHTEDEFVRELDLYIESDTYLVARVSYRDPNDNLVTLDFSDWKLNVKPQPGDYRFQTPPGVEEVRVL